jgi:hypothetical protein
MDPNRDRAAIVHRNDPNTPNDKLQAKILRMIKRNKMAVIKTRMIRQFDKFLLSDARENPGDQRVRLSDLTMRRVARKTWQWTYRFCRYHKKAIKTPAMNEWLDHFMVESYPGAFADPAVRLRIRREGHGPY